MVSFKFGPISTYMYPIHGPTHIGEVLEDFPKQKRYLLKVHISCRRRINIWFTGFSDMEKLAKTVEDTIAFYNDCFNSFKHKGGDKSGAI